MPTLSTTRTASMLSAQVVQWMVITAEQIGYFDVEGPKGHGADESPDDISYRTWDVWLKGPTLQAHNWEIHNDKDTICCAIPWTWMPFKASCQWLVETGEEVHFPGAGEVYDHTATEPSSKAFL